MKKLIVGMSAITVLIGGSAFGQVKSLPLSFSEYEQKQSLPIKIVWFSKILESGKFEKLKNIDNAAHLECLNLQVKEIDKVIHDLNMDDKKFMVILSTKGIKSLSFSFTHNENTTDPGFSVSMMSVENSIAAFDFGMSLAEDEKSTICKLVKQEAIQYTLKEKFGITGKASILPNEFKKVGTAPTMKVDTKVNDGHKGLMGKKPEDLNITKETTSGISK